ncbi:MAG: hypothetical protein EA398_08650 [Deltaproteobacteria bacterium]|nr:MAG: hypothetical protein EA398_08650 [Deltaproteobacteria bacterium]
MTARFLFQFLLLALLGSAVALGACNRDSDAPEASDEAAEAPEAEGEAAEEAADEIAAAGEGEGADPAAAPGQPEDLDLAQLLGADGAGEAPPAHAFAEGGTEVTASDFNLVGSWGMDVQAMTEAALESAPEDMTEEMRMQLEMQAAMAQMMQMSFEFRDETNVNIRISMMGETQEEAGTYEVVSREGNVIAIRMAATDPEAGMEAETAEFTIVNSNTLRAEEDGQALILRRLQ